LTISAASTRSRRGLPATSSAVADHTSLLTMAHMQARQSIEMNCRAPRSPVAPQAVGPEKHSL